MRWSASTAIGSMSTIPASFEIFARQIEPADAGILVEVAQDVGELQRAAQMMGELEAGLLLHAEHLDRKPAHRARHPVAIKIERGEIGRDDVLGHVHVHAVDDGEEILLAQAVMVCTGPARNAARLGAPPA